MAWRGEKDAGEYEDKAGFCKAATLEEIQANDYVLTPGRYVGAAEIEDDGIPFEAKMKELSQTLYQKMQDAEKLDAVIRGNLEVLGYAFDVTMGQSPPGSTYNEVGEGMPFFQGKTDFGFRFPTNRIYCKAPKRLADKGQTLVSVRAPVGDTNMAAEDCCIGRGVAAVQHKSGSLSFTYYSMNQLSAYFEQFEAEGTVFGSINQKDFKALPHVEPSSEIITTFNDMAGALDGRIELSTLDINALTKLRETLLPKLISGELRIPEAQQQTEAAVA